MGSAFHIEHFGCRAARADGEAVSERLRASGLVEDEAGADVVVVNTCSVTAEADRAARAYIRRAHRRNPEARIVVTGCYAQRAPEELAEMAGVAAVVGNSHKAFAPQIALRVALGEEAASPASQIIPVGNVMSANAVPVWTDDRFAHSFLEDLQLVPGTQTRPNLKIQEGCGNRCTFCVIPLTRGPSRSLAEDRVMHQVQTFVANGGNELVLSGINLGRWGRELVSDDGSRLTLSRLVRRIFEDTHLPRLRLSSIEPMDWDAELIALMREFGGTRLARHAHLPLQSGSDSLLRRMHRRYRPWHYAAKVGALLEAAGSHLTVGADVMVGFPGETDAEFDETVNFIDSLPFGYLHLFPFSARPGTPGWALHAASAVPAKVVEDRMAVLRALSAKKSERHRRQFLAQELEVITLHTPEVISAQGRTSALAENFIPVEIDRPLPANCLMQVKVIGINQDLSLLAEPSLTSKNEKTAAMFNAPFSSISAEMIL